MQIKYDIRLKSVNQTASSFDPYLLSRENNVPICKSQKFLVLNLTKLWIFLANKTIDY